MGAETTEPDEDFTQIAKQLLALVVQARRISKMIGDFPEDAVEAKHKTVEAA